MIDETVEPDVDPVEAQFRALLSLHAIAGRVDASRLPGFSPMPLGTALELVAAAPLEQVSRGMRLDVLLELARKELPGLAENEQPYRALMATVVADRDLQVEDLRRDLLASPGLVGGFQSTTSRAALGHAEAAFVGQDVCTTRRVTVGGRQAVWIYAEFETDAAFGDVATWLDPQRWSKWGPHFFRKMDIIGSKGPIRLPPPGTEHWHALFREVVQFPWTDLDTLLDCAYWREGDRAAGMTYDLDRSLDSQIDVDRGFILVNEVVPSPSATGAAASARPLLRVKVLKIVGFTEDVWDLAAEWVCPFWTEFVRGAVEGATTSTPKAPTHFPELGAAAWLWRESVDAWIGFLGDSAAPYLDLMEEATQRVAAHGLDTTAVLDVQKRYWSQLAKDWAKAWNHGLRTVDDVADRGLEATFAPPAGAATATAARPTATAATGQAEMDGTTIPVDGLDASTTPVCSDLTSIEPGAATIAARDVGVTVETLQDGRSAVRLRTTAISPPTGLYVGHLTIGQGRPVVPVQLYVSRATRN